MSGASGLIARLDKELRDLWKKPEDPRAAPLSRVCTMNLEVVAPNAEVLERYAPVIDEVTASIPARSILASIEPDAKTDEMTGSATAVCSLEGNRQICSERITLACPGNSAARAASAMEAFLVPEIPTALVWLGRVHVDDPIFQDLANDANRIILDSEYTSIASLIHVASWARKQPNAPQIADLAWTRIAIWQEMLARFFDAKENQPLASKITRIGLKQASEAGTRLGPESALMLGWIGTRLGWKTSRLGGTVRMKRPDGGSVSLDLRSVPRPQGVAPHALAELSFEAGDGEQKLTGLVERDLGSGVARSPDAPATIPPTTLDADVVKWKLTKPDGAVIEQRVRLGANKAAKWLERTLHRPASDAAFVESVAFAEQIIEDGLTVS